MGRTDPRALASQALGIAALALVAGCAEPAYVTPASSPPVEGASITSGEEPVEGDGDVVDVDEPPVADIEAYPSFVYEGVPVYYVGGLWYGRGAHGWRYYRHEPPELGRQRAAHEHEARWVQASHAPHPQPVQHPRAAPPEPLRAPEQPVPEHRATTVPVEQPRPAPVEQPRPAPAQPPRAEPPPPAHAAPPPHEVQPRPAPPPRSHTEPPPPTHAQPPPPSHAHPPPGH